MRKTRLTLTVAALAAMAVGTITRAHAQYYPRPYPTWNGCPPDWTIQGGVCKPYRHGPWDRNGPVAGGWRTRNGCPPDWTVQGGVCKPYRHGPWDWR
jgi:hypothetical protein